MYHIRSPAVLPQKYFLLKTTIVPIKSKKSIYLSTVKGMTKQQQQQQQMMMIDYCYLFLYTRLTCNMPGIFLRESDII
jgi:hypothetical protein